MSGGREMPRRFRLVPNRIYYYWDDVRENMRARFRSPRAWLALGAAVSWAVLIVALTYLFFRIQSCRALAEARCKYSWGSEVAW